MLFYDTCDRDNHHVIYDKCDIILISDSALSARAIIAAFVAHVFWSASEYNSTRLPLLNKIDKLYSL